ncbi:amino acid permease [Microbacteriaceae bacterium 4G12]
MKYLFHKKSVQALLLQNNNKHIQKTLGAFDLVLLGIGAIVGIGILVLTGVIAATHAGPAVIFSFMLSAFVCTFVAFCYAEVASTIPSSGGVYTYSYVTIGEFVAFLTGWAQILMYVLSVAAVANGWSAYFISFIKGFHIELPKVLYTVPQQGGIMNLPAICIILIITWVLSQGVKESKRVTNIMVGMKLFIILLFVIVGIFYVRPTNWTPFMPFGVQGVITGAAAVFFAFLGFDAVATAAEDVKQPQRDLPIGIIGSLLVCTFLYVVVSLVLTGMVPYQLLNVSDAMAFALQRVGQNFTAGILSVGALAGIMSVILAYLYAGVRIVYSISRDHLLPKAFSRTNAKTNAPVFTTWMMGLAGAALGGFVDLKALSDFINMTALLTFIMVALAVIILRKTNADLPRGFKAPLVPFLPLFTIGCCLFMMTRLSGVTWLYFGVWIALGACAYYLYTRKQTRPVSEPKGKIS